MKAISASCEASSLPIPGNVENRTDSRSKRSKWGRKAAALCLVAGVSFGTTSCIESRTDGVSTAVPIYTDAHGNPYSPSPSATVAKPGKSFKGFRMRLQAPGPYRCQWDDGNHQETQTTYGPPSGKAPKTTIAGVRISPACANYPSLTGGLPVPGSNGDPRTTEIYAFSAPTTRSKPIPLGNVVTNGSDPAATEIYGVCTTPGQEYVDTEGNVSNKWLGLIVQGDELLNTGVKQLKPDYIPAAAAGYPINDPSFAPGDPSRLKSCAAIISLDSSQFLPR